MTNEQHELVGKLLHVRHEGMVYRVESVDLDAFPSEQELTLRPVYACKKEPNDNKNRTKQSRENWMAGTGHQSARWAESLKSSVLTEREVERMKERDE